MYILIYSIDYQDYMDRCDDDPYIQEGEKQYLIEDTKEECINTLLDKINLYDEDIYENELRFITEGEYFTGVSYLTVHKFYEIKSTLSFDIKNTKQYKDFIKNKVNEQKVYEEYRKEEETKRELQELQRLKEKYEN